MNRERGFGYGALASILIGHDVFFSVDLLEHCVFAGLVFLCNSDCVTGGIGYRCLVGSALSDCSTGPVLAGLLGDFNVLDALVTQFRSFSVEVSFPTGWNCGTG